MNNNYNQYSSNYSYQQAQYFPQPQGNAYIVDNSLEVANIPMGTGISVILCPSEGSMYLKAMQNGSPSISVYKISPFNNNQNNKNENQNNDQNIQSIILKIEEKISKLEKTVDKLSKNNIGGGLNELL